TKSIREDFLHQSAFDPDDEYTKLDKQYRMLKAIMNLHEICEKAIERDESLDKLLELPVRQKIARMRHIKEDKFDEFDAIEKEMKLEVEGKAKVE
ncbi:MAG TPA: hypothetical protein VKO43_04415, partial [Candidatus Krumholzibacteriaceae bacterium]|nr:hypothetical protein [Candidatus Krumholzibacteriaceae bacterium]